VSSNWESSTAAAAGLGPPYRVALGRFSPVIALGLRAALGADRGLRIVGEGFNRMAMEVAVVELAPHVAIVGQASLAGQSDLRRLWALRPELGLIAFGILPTGQYGERLLELGFAACLSVDASEAEIFGAIRSAVSGERPATGSADPGKGFLPTARLASLTVREQEVFRLLVQFQTNAAIASELQITIETVRTHVKHILRKLHVLSRHELRNVPIPDDW
jgi:DNA-binding NarL/FixJ family response regulator